MPAAKASNKPSSFAPLKVITYIDGFNLYFGMREQQWQKYMWLDVVALSRTLLKGNQELVLTKYFTSRVSGSKEKQQRQNVYLDALSTLEPLKMYFGRFQNDRRECQQCGRQAFSPQEKKTDVNIATELLCDAHSGAFDTALVISGDADLVPPITAIRRLFPDKTIIVAFPPKRFSAELVLSAHASFPIYEAKLRKSRMSATIVLPSGITVTRPEKWAGTTIADAPSS